MLMDFSFAKDSKIFSQAIEELRKEGADLRDAGVIKERYEALEKKSGKKPAKVEDKKPAKKVAKKAAKKAKK